MPDDTRRVRLAIEVVHVPAKHHVVVLLHIDAERYAGALVPYGPDCVCDDVLAAAGLADGIARAMTDAYDLEGKGPAAGRMKS